MRLVVMRWLAWRLRWLAASIGAALVVGSISALAAQDAGPASDASRAQREFEADLDEQLWQAFRLGLPRLEQGTPLAAPGDRRGRQGRGGARLGC
jgi:hypothetical protein